MTPDMKELPAELGALAGKLTEAQRRALLGASDNGHFMTCDFTDPWTVPAAEFLTLRTDRLTPLGLSLRAYLQSNPIPDLDSKEVGR